MKTREEEIKHVASKLADTNIGPYNEYDYTDHSGHNTYRCAYEEGIIAAFKYVDEHPQSPWISVSDKMPEEFEVVIAYAANGHIENSYWDGHYWTGDFYDTTVIYWMPLPELPKGGEKMNKTSKCKDCEFNKHGWCNLYDVDLPLYGECYNW